MKKWLKGFVATSAAVLSLGAAFTAVDVEAQDTKELTVYSNALSNGRQEWLDEQAQAAGFQLEFVEGGSGDIYNRLLAEAGDPQADVVFGMDEVNWTTITEEGLVRQYSPAWAADLPEDALTGDGYFHPTTEERITMYYNSDSVSAEDIPARMEDFGKDENWTEQYRVPVDFGGSTNQKIALSILLQYQDENGELGISEEGWTALGDFLANGYLTAEGEDHVQSYVDGAFPVTYYWSSGVSQAIEEYGANMEPINFEPGVITMREQVGIVEKGDDNDYSAAEEFVEWFGSAEVQGGWAEAHGTWPVNPAAQEQAGDTIRYISENTDVMDVDWDFVRENIDSWVEKIELDLLP
ncbi:extracellular solute-binding protein [Aerococcaceae bacterium DSM 111176]|nr:extracellular solute-binding protein [Aerococcaceae bacterium DSM 111176]